IKIQLAQIVEHVNRLTVDEDQFSRRQAGELIVDVPADGNDRRDRFQALQQVPRADVAAMHDEVKPPKRFDYRIPQEAVSIGNDGKSFNRIKLPVRTAI